MGVKSIFLIFAAVGFIQISNGSTFSLIDIAQKGIKNIGGFNPKITEGIIGPVDEGLSIETGLEGSDVEINEKLSSLEQAKNELELSAIDLRSQLENTGTEFSGIFAEPNDVNPPIESVFTSMAKITNAFQSVLSISEKAINTVNIAYYAVRKVENRVKSRVDEVRVQVENQIREANTQDSKVFECAVQAGKPFQGVAENLYLRNKKCLTDKIDGLTGASLNIVQQLRLAANTTRDVNQAVLKCVQQKKSSLVDKAKFVKCLVGVAGVVDRKSLFVAPKILIEVTKAGVIINTFVPSIEACSAATVGLIGTDLIQVLFGVQQCIFAPTPQ